MTSFRILLALFASLGLAACGGGGITTTSTGDLLASGGGSAARWVATSMRIEGVSVGSTTIRHAEIINEGNADADFSRFDGLPSGLTASGCPHVAAGATCRVTFTYAPTKVSATEERLDDFGLPTLVPVAEVAKVAPSTVKMTWPLVVNVSAVDASLHAITFGGTGFVTSWEGTLEFPAPDGTPLVLESVKMVSNQGQTVENCYVTIRGSYQTQFAENYLQIGELAFKMPAQGEFDVAKNQTTFTQPQRDHACWWAGLPGSLFPVIMY